VHGQQVVAASNDNGSGAADANDGDCVFTSLEHHSRALFSARLSHLRIHAQRRSLDNIACILRTSAAQLEQVTLTALHTSTLLMRFSVHTADRRTRVLGPL
jgi:hypothetical protein